jgi:hypothetical protein
LATKQFKQLRFQGSILMMLMLLKITNPSQNVFSFTIIFCS